MDSVSDTLAGGFPHSEICGSEFVRNSPQLIAAYHVLHRLSAPRHPPNALKALDHSHCRCPPALWAERSRQEKRPASRFVRSRAVKTASLRHAADAAFEQTFSSRCQRSATPLTGTPRNCFLADTSRCGGAMPASPLSAEGPRTCRLNNPAGCTTNEVSGGAGPSARSAKARGRTT
jgi:hypothetical protein